jgi:pyridinium-3,5-bisthiocarboxylic acid mononucleotide nickel chelatase
MIGEQFAGESDCVTVIETNIDDLNPEFYESVMEKLFAAGAFDVFLTPIQMKKSRPAVILSTICSPPNGQEIATIILRETSAFGVRMSQKERICLKRRTEQVTTEFGAIKVKIGEMNDQIMSVSPEYNDCKKAASEHNVPIKMVYDAVKAASRIKTEKPTL